MRRLLFVQLLLMAMIGCSSYIDPANAPKWGEKNWIPLCNSQDLTGWVKRNKDTPMSWKVIDGMIVNTSSHDNAGTDIYTEQKFDDFEIYYEYRIPKGSNSGLYLRGRYEIQIIDDVGWSTSKLQPKQFNGAIYGLYPPSENNSRKVGQWQSVYAKLVGKRMTVILNGRKIHDNVNLPQATGSCLDRKVDQPGPILLQGYHGCIEFRNMMLRPIEG